MAAESHLLQPSFMGLVCKQDEWQEAKPHADWWVEMGRSQTSQAEQTSQNPIIWQVEALADGWEVTGGKENKYYSSMSATE